MQKVLLYFLCCCLVEDEEEEGKERPRDNATKDLRTLGSTLKMNATPKGGKGGIVPDAAISGGGVATQEMLQMQMVEQQPKQERFGCFPTNGSVLSTNDLSVECCAVATKWVRTFEFLVGRIGCLGWRRRMRFFLVGEACSGSDWRQFIRGSGRSCTRNAVAASFAQIVQLAATSRWTMENTTAPSSS